MHGADSVEAKSLTIGGLLEHRHPFAVPRYQRAYAWPDTAVSDFVADITALLAKPTGSVGHFFGGVVCIERTNNDNTRPLSYEVVDGQQRLATFALALSCVVEVAEDLRVRAAQGTSVAAATAANRSRVVRDGVRSRFLYWTEDDVDAGEVNTKPRLVLSLVDDPVFQRLLSGEPAAAGVQGGKRESHELLEAARIALLDMTTSHVRTTGSLGARVDRLVRLRDALIVDSHLIHIVSKERQQAYRLFSVLNHRGESLSDADLLRSRSLELLEGFPTDQEATAKIWDEMLARPAKTVEAFFLALYPSTTGRRASGNLFEQTAAHFFPPAPPTTSTAAKKICGTVAAFRDELETFAQLSDGTWPYTRPPGAPSPVHMWQTDRLRRLVLTLKHELALPLLLAGARSLPEKRFAELVYLLEVFAFRYKNICNGHAGKPANEYYTHSAAMRCHNGATAYSLKSLRDALRALIGSGAGDQRFRDSLVEKLRYSNTSQRANIRAFLTTLEDYQQWLAGNPQANAKPKPTMNKVTDVDAATIEHIYPHNAPALRQDATLEPVKHHLGNLTFFSDKDNVAAGHKTFATKQVSDYANSDVLMTRELASLPAWDLQALEDRETCLLNQAVRVFVV